MQAARHWKPEKIDIHRRHVLAEFSGLNRETECPQFGEQLTLDQVDLTKVRSFGCSPRVVAVFYETAGMSVALDSKVLDESNVRPYQFAEPMRWIQTYRDNLSGQCVRHERSTLNEPPGFGETILPTTA
jgi:hypothetical protein